VVLVIEPGRVAGSLRFDRQALGGDRRTGAGCGRSPLPGRRGAGHRARPRSPVRCGSTGRPWVPIAAAGRLQAVTRSGPWCWSSSPAAVAGLLPFDVASANGRRLIAGEMSGRMVRTVRPWCWSSSPAAVAGSLRFDRQALAGIRARGRPVRPWWRSSPGGGFFCAAFGCRPDVPTARKNAETFMGVYPAAAGPFSGSSGKSLREQSRCCRHLLAGSGCRGNRPRGAKHDDDDKPPLRRPNDAIQVAARRGFIRPKEPMGGAGGSIRVGGLCERAANPKPLLGALPERTPNPAAGVSGETRSQRPHPPLSKLRRKMRTMAGWSTSSSAPRKPTPSRRRPPRRRLRNQVDDQPPQTRPPTDCRGNTRAPGAPVVLVIQPGRVAGSLRFDRQALGADRRRGPAAGGHQVRAVVLVIEPGRRRRLVAVRPAGPGWRSPPRAGCGRSPLPGRRGAGHPARPRRRLVALRRGQRQRPPTDCRGNVRARGAHGAPVVLVIEPGRGRQFVAVRPAGPGCRSPHGGRLRTVTRSGPWCWSSSPAAVAGLLPFDVASANGRRLIAGEMSGRVVRTVRPWCWSSSPAASPARCGSTWPAPTAAD